MNSAIVIVNNSEYFPARYSDSICRSNLAYAYCYFLC